MLVNHLEEVGANRESTKVLQLSRDIDLNMPIVEEHAESYDRTVQVEIWGKGYCLRTPIHLIFSL